MSAPPSLGLKGGSTAAERLARKFHLTRLGKKHKLGFGLSLISRPKNALSDFYVLQVEAKSIAFCYSNPACGI